MPSINNNRVRRVAYPRFIEYRQRRIRCLQSPDTVRQTFGTSGQLQKFATTQRVLHYGCELSGKIDQANSNFTQSAAGHIAPPMRRTDKDNALDSRIRSKCCGANNQIVAGILGENVSRGVAYGFLPHGRRQRNDLVMREHPTHAVTDDDEWLMVRV